MPRLLLVDDNPSIHKIAETLLSSTGIDLVCVASGDAALEKVQAGELFDVALVDTSMIGMDGWTLLRHLRDLPSTARIPIAMMAGVLDSVDPALLESAPIQGFLKKPVELRELGDRVQRLLATPVPEPPPAVIPPTVPAIDPAEAFAAGTATQGLSIPFDLGPADMASLDLDLPVDDLLLLEPEDLLEPAASTPRSLPPLAEEEGLELEELDLDALQETEEPAPVPAVAAGETSPVVVLPEVEALFPAGEDASWTAAPWDQEPLPPGPADFPTGDDLPDLGEIVAAAEAPTVMLDAAHGEDPLSVEHHLESELDLSLEEELDIAAPPPPQEAAAHSGEGLTIPVTAAAAAAALGISAFALHDSSTPEPVAPAPVPPEPPPAPAGEATGATSAQALVEALLQDPAAMDALAKALAARLADKVLREIAWEVIPEIADRLKA